MDSNRIRVVARIRPKTRKEIGERITVTRLEDYCTLQVAGSTEDDLEEVRQSAFRFDSVYNEDDDQVTIYEEECAEIVDHCLSGNPATVLGYGQTGSGKTTTILGRTGPDGGLHADSGVFLRVFCDLFRCGIKSVLLSAIELYMDEVHDLLENRTRRKLRDAGAELGVSIQGMKQMTVNCLEDVLLVFDIANNARSTTSTQMNDQSSRSHAVFFITIPPSTENTTDVKKKRRPNPVQLMLVDLAGSERIKKSKAEGNAIAEATAINASLSTLGTVVHAMYVNSNHVPYRDSKLTGVLKSTFSNKQCRVLLIGQFSPAASNSLESISTAKFCDRVKGLACNTPFANGCGGDGEEGSVSEADQKAILACLKAAEEISTELRIARTLIGMKKRKSFKPTVSSSATGEKFHIAHITSPEQAEKLKQEIEDEIAEHEQYESREAISKCEEMKEQLFQKAIAKREKVQNDLLQWQQKSSGIKDQYSQFLQKTEGEITSKTTEAKRAKKKRIVADEKLSELKKKFELVQQELQVTPENYVLPPSLVDFEADDDPEAEAAEKREEANHAIIADFYTHSRTLSRIHCDFMNYNEKVCVLSAEKADIRKNNDASSFYVWQFASDVVAFSWQRACDCGEGLTDIKDSWAWTDVIGSSRFLLDASEWVPNPLSLIPEFPKQPVENENLRMRTILSDENLDVSDNDNNNEEFDNDAFIKKYGKQQQQQNDNNKKKATEKNIPVVVAAAASSTSAVGSSDKSDNSSSSSSSIAAVESNTAAATTTNNNNNNKATTKKTLAIDVIGASPEMKPGASGLFDFPSLPGMQKKLFVDNNKPSATATTTTASSKAQQQAKKQSEENSKENINKNDTSQKSSTSTSSSGSTSKTATKTKTTTTTTISRRKKTPEELALAEKHYLMSIYDSKTLVTDILKFLTNGTDVMKHGRAGDPHKRHAWVKDRHLYWVDPDPNLANRQRHHVQVSDIGSVTMGPHSKVFKRNPIPISDPKHFLSFSVHLKDGSRSVDFTCENLVDFEAWVIGMVNLAQVDCMWGKQLNCASLEPQEYSQLTAFEKALCDKENIRPSVFNKVRSKIIDMRADVAMHMRAFHNDAKAAFKTMGGDALHMPKMAENGAILMTKGELRYHCNEHGVDIFRVCKMFEYFRDMGIIFDSDYTPMCRYGVTNKIS